MAINQQPDLIGGPLVAGDVELRAAFLALSAIEDPQRHPHADAHELMERRLIAEIRLRDGRKASVDGYRWIHRSVREGQLMVGLRLLNRLKGGAEVGANGERDPAEFIERLG